jgi:hypothetical protein
MDFNFQIFVSEPGRIFPSLYIENRKLQYNGPRTINVGIGGDIGHLFYVIDEEGEIVDWLMLILNEDETDFLECISLSLFNVAEFNTYYSKQETIDLFSEFFPS